MADSQSADWNGGYSGARVRRPVSVDTAVTICDAIIDALLEAGWEDRGPTAARAAIVLPFGAPTVTIPTDPGPYTAYTQTSHSIQGDVITWYDPYRGAPDARPNAIWVTMSLTSE